MSLIDEARGVRQRIAERLRELEPLVAEYHQLRQLAADMGLEATAEAAPEAPPDAPAAGARRRPRPRAAAGRGTRARGGARASARRAAGSEPPAPGGDEPNELVERVLEAVRATPGRTVAEYSDLLGVAPTALYRPVRELTTDGALVKRARQLFPAED